MMMMMCTECKGEESCKTLARTYALLVMTGASRGLENILSKTEKFGALFP